MQSYDYLWFAVFVQKKNALHSTCFIENIRSSFGREEQLGNALILTAFDSSVYYKYYTQVRKKK